MSRISTPVVVNDVTIGFSLAYRCWFDAGGVGVTGLLPTLVVTEPDQTALTPLTLGIHWTRSELLVPGDYEIRIAMSSMAQLGLYTVEVASGDPGAGVLVDHLDLLGVYGRVNDAGATPTTFITTLPSIVTDFYKDSFILMATGSLAGSGPKKVSAYNGSTKAITIASLPAAPVNGDGFYLIRY